LIDEISEIAIEAIEQAAAEAARAAALAAIEREAAALREASYQQAEALRWRNQALLNLQGIEAAKRAGRKNTILAALVGTLGGLLVGFTGTLVIGGR
jgi:hypothetical protein